MLVFKLVSWNNSSPCCTVYFHRGKRGAIISLISNEKSTEAPSTPPLQQEPSDGPQTLSLSLWVSDLDGSSERERETWKLPASDLLEFKAIYITPPPPASPTNLQSRPSSWSQVSLLHLVSAKSGHMSTCQSTRHFLCGGAPADEDTGGSHGAHRSPKVRFRGAQFPTTGQDNSMNYPPKCMRFFSVT